MSGEVVAEPIAIFAVGALPLVAGGMLASGIKSIVDKQVEAAVRKIEEKEAEIAEWIHSQRMNEQRMSALRESHSAVQATMDRLLKAGLSERRSDSAGTGPTAFGYYSLQDEKSNTTREVIEGLLAEIQQILTEVPSSISTETDSPFPRLLQQVERLQKKAQSAAPPGLEEVKTFHVTIQRTISTYLESNERKRQTLNVFIDRIKKIHAVAETWRSLASTPEQVSGLDSLLSELKSLLQADSIQPGRLGFLEKLLANLKTDIEERMTQATFRNTLAGAVTKHLDEMGYHLVQNFPGSNNAPVMPAAVAIPGGERLQIVITYDNRLAFQVAHEALQGEKELSPAQKKHFRAQEKKWCKDMPELLRRLTSDGFLYGIQHEKDVRDEGIRTVVVENVEEILASRDEEQINKHNARKADEKRRKRALEQANRKRRM